MGGWGLRGAFHLYEEKAFTITSYNSLTCIDEESRGRQHSPWAVQFPQYLGWKRLVETQGPTLARRPPLEPPPWRSVALHSWPRWIKTKIAIKPFSIIRWRFLSLMKCLQYKSRARWLINGLRFLIAATIPWIQLGMVTENLRNVSATQKWREASFP